jgi:hypothetical protein
LIDQRLGKLAADLRVVQAGLAQSAGHLLHEIEIALPAQRREDFPCHPFPQSLFLLEPIDQLLAELRRALMVESVDSRLQSCEEALLIPAHGTNPQDQFLHPRCL